MKVRPAHGTSLSAAMQSVVEVATRRELLAHLREHFPFWSPTDANVTIKRHCYDPRTGWDTHLISVDGKAALFSDGPLPDE